MAMLTTKFNLGDEVWRITEDHASIQLPCRVCRGRSMLEAKGANDEVRLVKCPECGVNATVTLGTWPQWRVEPGPLRIGLITVRVCDHQAADGQRAPGAEDEENYMCWSTGVGSGTVHHVEDLFATRDEAEEEAERRTERSRAGEKPGGRERWHREWWPSVEQVRAATGFLDHRDLYEHDAAHVALAEAIINVAVARKAKSR